MNNYEFEPTQITIAPGTRVIWTNKSSTTHTTTSGSSCSGDGKWNSGNMDAGQTFSHTFDAEGTFNYFCAPHCSMGMTGIVTVKAGTVNTGTVVSDSTQGSQTKRKKGPIPGFKGLDIINSPSTYVLTKGYLDVSIFHRFDDMFGPNGGGQVLFGLDNMRDMRIALSYGLFKNITIGVGRSKGDWFNTPYQLVKNLYDGSVRWAIIRQDSCKKIPVSITAYGNTVYCAMKSQDIPGAESNFQYFSDRFSHCAQVMISRDFGQRVSLQVMPVYVRRNWVNVCGYTEDELDMFSLGAGGRIALTRNLALIGEYYYTFSGYHHKYDDRFFDPLAVGLEINTGGHVFHLNLSNATGIIPNTYIPYTTASWANTGYRFGFSIERKFNMKNIKRKN